MEKLTRLLRAIDKNLLKFLLAIFVFLIPLYPKFPLTIVNYTYVAIRLEDLYVALIVIVFFIQILRRKVPFPTFFTKSILFFWLTVFLALLSGLYLTKTIEFPHLGFLHALRRVEYIIVFFIAASTVSKIEDFKLLLYSLLTSLFLVNIYGLGQRLLNWPAVSTMNPEFAKGKLLFLTPEARLTSTFAGHYDLAAYLVFLIAILWGVYFAKIDFRLNLKKKLIVALAALLTILVLIFSLQVEMILIFLTLMAGAAIFLIFSGQPVGRVLTFILILLSIAILIFTASRTSFIAYMISTPALIIFLRKYKHAIFVIALSLLLFYTSKDLAQRFSKTFQIKQIIVSEKTGEAYVSQKITTKELPAGTTFLRLRQKTEETEESKRLKQELVKKATLEGKLSAEEQAAAEAEYKIITGFAADISFATRLQVEWPRAIKAFLTNPLLGTGPSSITESTDNDYLRWLGEFGLLGFLAFLNVIFQVVRLVFKRAFQVAKGSRPLLLALLFAIFGLLINASYIDVFEASKVAYVFWYTIGIYIGLLSLPSKKIRLT